MTIRSADDDDEAWRERFAGSTQEELDTNLCVAALDGNLELMKFLLKAGARADAYGSICLDHARNHRLVLTECLIDAGADMNAQPFLCHAIAAAKSAIAVLMIEKGADTSLSHEGLDASGWATEMSDVAVINALHRVATTQKPAVFTAQTREKTTKTTGIGEILAAAGRHSRNRYKL